MKVYLVDHAYDGWSSAWSTLALAEVEADRLNARYTNDLGTHAERWHVVELVLDDPGRATSTA